MLIDYSDYSEYGYYYYYYCLCRVASGVADAMNVVQTAIILNKFCARSAHTFA